MIQWGILATGTIAHKFAKTLLSMDKEAALVACASRKLEKAEEFAKQYQIPRYYGSYEELAGAPEVDVIYIATPNSMHYENIKMCIEAGKHVLCEKPMTLNAKEAKELFELAKQKNIFLMEGFWIQLLPLYDTVKKILQAGEIGEIQHLSAAYGFIAQGARKARKFEYELGGGALLDIGVYVIGFTSMILGYYPEKMKSFVKINEVGTDEFENVILQYSQGKTASLAISIGINMPKEAVIYGTNGRMRFDDFQNAQKVTIEFNDGMSRVIESPFEINGFEYQIREAISCIESGKYCSDIQTPEKTVAVLEVMDSLRYDWGMKWESEKAQKRRI